MPESKIASANIPLILLPGILCTEKFWQQTRIDASTKNIEAQCIELCEGSSLKAMVEAILAKAPKQFYLAGFSMGAVVASSIAIRAPERVKKLILLSLNRHGLLASVRKNLENLKTEIEARRYLQAIKGMGAHYAHKDSSKDFIPWYEAMTQTVDPKIALAQLNMLLTASPQDFTQIKCPTLIIAGANDERTPPNEQHALAQTIPHASYIEIPKAGHFALIDQPDLVNQAIFDFL